MDQITYSFGNEAVSQLVDFCKKNQFERFMLVCDQNTYAVLGAQVEAAIRQQDWDVKTVVLEGKEVVPNEEYLVQVLIQADASPRVYLGVGSGTITDITRFCSHRSRNPFISLPTAPSVDGFASLIAAVVVRGFKDNAYAQAPLAIFGDSRVLCSAPPGMIAAGFGDLLGKYISLADWKLGHLLWDTPYNSALAARTERALVGCVEKVDGLHAAEPEAVSSLLGGLVETGICMLLNGNSLPASGSEHHLSHYWEMKLLRQGRPAVLHGAKVGIGTVLSAERYARIRALTQKEVEQRLRETRLPERGSEERTIEAVYGPIAAQVKLEQRRFLEMTSQDFDRLKEKIASSWQEILQIATTVPPAERIVELLRKVAGPTEVSMVGLDDEDQREALGYAHYLRNQFTVAKLGRLLGS